MGVNILVTTGGGGVLTEKIRVASACMFISCINDGVHSLNPSKKAGYVGHQFYTKLPVYEVPGYIQVQNFFS